MRSRTSADWSDGGPHERTHPYRSVHCVWTIGHHSVIRYCRVFGVTVLLPVTEGGWYEPNGLMVLAPSAFILIGCLIGALRAWQPEQVEEDFRVGALLEPGYESHLR